MPEISAIGMKEVLHSNISDDKTTAIFTFKTIRDEDMSIAVPIPQLIPLIELAMIELRKSGLGADVAALEADQCSIESADSPERFALAFENPNGGRMSFSLPKKDLPKLRLALQAVD